MDLKDLKMINATLRNLTISLRILDAENTQDHRENIDFDLQQLVGWWEKTKKQLEQEEEVSDV